MKASFRWVGGLAVATLLNAPGAHAQQQPASQSLEQRLEEQEQRIRVLERRLELQQADAKSASDSASVVKASSSGFSLASRDSANQLRFRGLVHADARSFLDNAAPGGSDTFLLRRVRPTLEGTLGGIFDFRFTPDFGSGRTVIQDAYVVARFRPAFALTAGKFKTPFGIERLQSASSIRFIERGLPNNLVPNRDLGVQLSGELLGGTLSYAVALLNGTADGGSSEGNASPDTDNNDDKDLALRLFAQPFRASDTFALRGLGFGVAASRSSATGAPAQTLLGGYRTPGQQTFFGYRGGTSAAFADGERVRWSVQGHYYYGSLGLLGEYIAVSQDLARTVGALTRIGSVDHDAWQLAAGWFVTGEDAAFRVPAPRVPYAKGTPGWGAIELVARVGELDVDDAVFEGGAASFADPVSAASRALAWAVGVNWYLTQGTKISLDYEQTSFDGGAALGDRPDEKALFSRIQIAF